MIPVNEITMEWCLTERRCDGSRDNMNPTRHATASGHAVGAQQEKIPIVTEGIDTKTGITMVGIETSRATVGSDGGSLKNRFTIYLYI